MLNDVKDLSRFIPKLSGIILRDYLGLESLVTMRVQNVSFRSTAGFTTFYKQLDFADDEDPVISSTPAAISQSTDATLATAVVTWTLPTARDNSGTYTLTSSHHSGDTFSLGATTVTYTAADAAGNTVMYTFTVTITGMY